MSARTNSSLADDCGGMCGLRHNAQARETATAEIDEVRMAHIALARTSPIRAQSKVVALSLLIWLHYAVHEAYTRPLRMDARVASPAVNSQVLGGCRYPSLGTRTGGWGRLFIGARLGGRGRRPRGSSGQDG